MYLTIIFIHQLKSRKRGNSCAVKGHRHFFYEIRVPAMQVSQIEANICIRVMETAYRRMSEFRRFRC